MRTRSNERTTFSTSSVYRRRPQCGETFQENLDGIVTALDQLGFRQVDVGKPISTDEAKAKGLM
jgi:hypothetical protein